MRRGIENFLRSKLEKLGRRLDDGEGKSYGKELHCSAGAKDSRITFATGERSIGLQPRVAPDQFSIEVAMRRSLRAEERCFGSAHVDGLDGLTSQGSGLVECCDLRDDDALRGVVVNQPLKMCVKRGSGFGSALEAMADQLDDMVAVQNRERQVGRPVVGREYPARLVFIRHPPDTAKMLRASARPQL